MTFTIFNGLESRPVPSGGLRTVNGMLRRTLEAMTAGEWFIYPGCDTRVWDAASDCGVIVRSYRSRRLNAVLILRVK